MNEQRLDRGAIRTLLLLLIPALPLRSPGWDRPSRPDDRPAVAPSALATAQARPAGPAEAPRDPLYSVMLDAPADPGLSLSLLWARESGVSGRRGTAEAFELDAFHRLARFRNVLWAQLDVAVHWHSHFWSQRPHIRIPAGLHRVTLDTGWTWRFSDGDAFELRLFPGLYGATDAALRDLTGMPFEGVWHRWLQPDLAGYFGLSVRPGWDIPLTPLAGLAWEPHRTLRLEAMVPRSRAFLYLGRVTWFGTAEWRNHSYAVDPQRNLAGRVTQEDLLVSGGLIANFSDELSLSAEGGVLFGRTLSSDADDHPRVHLANTRFVRLALRGPF